MTKVTAEMLERVDAVIDHAEQCAEPDGETAADLRALVELCRRVIEPGEEDLVAVAAVIDPWFWGRAPKTEPIYERGKLVAERLLDPPILTDPRTKASLAKARAVLAAIADPTAS